jgi:hypothetical protein
MSLFLYAALEYAAKGYAVFPLHSPLADGSCSCRNLSCKSIGKHPRTRSGVLSATTNMETIKKWWTQWPTANVAIATGRKSGIVVLDVDADRGGEDSLRLLEEQNEKLQPTLTVITGRGRHLYFRYPENQTVRNSHDKLGPGLDIKSDNAYVVAPPSRHPSGKVYQQWQDAA